MENLSQHETKSLKLGRKKTLRHCDENEMYNATLTS